MEMMSFAKNNWKRFGKSPVDCIPAFLIGFIKLFASLSTECLNLYIVVSARSTVDVVKDFVALLSVLYISYIIFYYSSMSCYSPMPRCAPALQVSLVGTEVPDDNVADPNNDLLRQ